MRDRVVTVEMEKCLTKWFMTVDKANNEQEEVNGSSGQRRRKVSSEKSFCDENEKENLK